MIQGISFENKEYKDMIIYLGHGDVLIGVGSISNENKKIEVISLGNSNKKFDLKKKNKITKEDETEETKILIACTGDIKGLYNLRKFINILIKDKIKESK